MDRVTWTEDAQPREMTLGKLLYNLRTDASGDPDLLMDAVTMDDLVQDPSIEQILVLFNPDIQIQKSDGEFDWTRITKVEMAAQRAAEAGHDGKKDAPF